VCYKNLGNVIVFFHGEVVGGYLVVRENDKNKVFKIKKQNVYLLPD
jgi:hypothetical protein